MTIFTPTEKVHKIEVCKALSHITRFTILEILTEKSLDIGQLAIQLNMTPASVSSNINILERAGLITVKYEPGDHGVRKVCGSKLTAIKIGV